MARNDNLDRPRAAANDIKQTWEQQREARIPTGVRARFVILYAGWELDNMGWIANDGRVYETSHGSWPYPTTEKALLDKIQETSASLHGLIQALASLREYEKTSGRLNNERLVDDDSE